MLLIGSTDAHQGRPFLSPALPGVAAGHATGRRVFVARAAEPGGDLGFTLDVRIAFASDSGAIADSAGRPQIFLR